MRPKHRNDYNHGKSGMVGGNPRYNRGTPYVARSMGAGLRPRTLRGSPNAAQRELGKVA